ncbi:hypothetical protein [Schleiferilactobacillus harbinensis]|uniref:hypothetical protein n=1 Tax=Schleiferilactobacillus harbinensis TaxID=304207 RepID=UPI0039EAD56E
MLEEQTIRDLLALPSFGRQASVLRRHLREPLEDASQDLVIELIEHRLKSWSDADVEDAITREMPELQWRITFARKDIERHEWHDERVEADKSEMLSLVIPPDPHSEQETSEAILRANSILHNRQSREWVASVLLHGKQQTMTDFNQTPRQFQAKLHKMVNFLSEHRKDIDK